MIAASLWIVPWRCESLWHFIINSTLGRIQINNATTLELFYFLHIFVL